jgi:ABC-2 type transport system ATP-binding protein
MVGVTKWYGQGGGQLALDGLDLVVPSGGVFGVLGRNGAGKTTALRCLLGLIRPTSGVCRVLGVDSSTDLHRVIGRIGALIETPGLAPSLTGRRNLALLARLDRIGADGVERALRSAGLAERADEPVAAYSLGMRQRLGIAAALLRDPEVVVLDEPANGLDPAGVAWLRGLLRGLAGQGRAVLVASHGLSEVAQTVDQVVIVSAGRLRFAGPLREIGTTSAALESAFLNLTGTAR